MPPGGIRIRSPSKLGAADQRLKPLDQWDRHISFDLCLICQLGLHGETVHRKTTDKIMNHKAYGMTLSFLFSAISANIVELAENSKHIIK